MDGVLYFFFGLAAGFLAEALAALVAGFLLAVGQNLGDAKRGQRLAMTLLAAIIGAPLLLEYHDFVAQLLLEDFGGNKRTGNSGASRLGAAIAAKQDDLRQLDDVARLAPDLFDLDDVVRRHAILLAARANDREHGL
jgi:hypothetical protein